MLAARLLNRLVARCDILLDLHTASRGRVNSLYVRADLTDPRTARIAYLQRPQILVHKAASDGTLRGAAAELGIPSVTVEIGDPQRFQRRYYKRAAVGVRAVLNDLKMVSSKPVPLGDEPIVCDRSQWTYADRGGFLTMEVGVVDRVEEGEVVARMTDVFGEPRAAFTAPEAGVVIGHAVDPVAGTGARILHLGHVSDPDNTKVLPRAAVLGPDAEVLQEVPWSC